MASSTGFLAFAILFTVFALFFVALSFSTDNWLEYTVNRDKLSGSTNINVQRDRSGKDAKPWYYTRHRGLFRTCYEGNNTEFLESAKYTEERVDKNCLYQDYQIPEDENFALKTEQYRIRIHLMRCWVGFFIVALVFLLAGCVVGAFGCWKSRATIARYAAVVVFIAAFSTAAAMAFFHGAEYLEKNEIKDDDSFPLMWPNELGANTVRRYGWSYILGWVGMVVGAIAAVLYLIAGWLLKQKERDEKVPFDSYSMRSRNKAYDYMDNRYDDYYKRGHVGPYEMGPGMGEGSWGWNRY